MNKQVLKGHFQGDTSEVGVNGHLMEQRPSTGQERALQAHAKALAEARWKGHERKTLRVGGRDVSWAEYKCELKARKTKEGGG